MAKDFEFSDDFEKHLHDMVERQVTRPWADAVRDDAQRSAPRESGELAASIEVNVVSWDHARIGSHLDYAADVEYGSHPHDILIRHGRDAGEIWRHPGAHAEPYLRPALYRERDL